MRKCTFVVLLTLLTFAKSNSFAARAKAIETEQVSQTDGDVDSEFRAWCDRTLRILERTRNAAAYESLRGDFVNAVATLVEGLRLETYQYRGQSPVTMRLIGHAHRLGVLLKREVGTDVRGLKATAIALESFYDLIFDTAQRIDYEHYRCWGPRRYCNYSRTKQFEAQMLTMVRDMLNLVNSNLVVARGNQVYPIGSSSTYLLASEVLSAAAYQDLSSLVYADAYACEILDLKEMSEDLAYFNRSEVDEVAKRYKMGEVYYDLNRIAQELAENRSCRH